ncbi:MAG: ABC transporter substrate-binding protein [Polyangiaceae bacterium]
MRIVSLLPAATEMVCAVGGAADLVGVSHECDFPDAVRGLPVLTRARIGGLPSSVGIDAAVRTLVSEALSVYAVDDHRLAELAPDVVITQDLCDVCAVSLDDVRAALASLAGRESVRIVSLRPTCLANVLDDVDAVALALGRSETGARARRALQGRIDAVAVRAARAKGRPRVLTIEWLDPIMLGGLWMPELIELAGGEPVGVRAGEPAVTVTPAELAALVPDVVLVKPCGFALARTLDERACIEGPIARAVGPHARIHASDGNAFFNRPGPRLVESLEILAACVHPEAFGDLVAKHAVAMRCLSRAGGRGTSVTPDWV